MRRKSTIFLMILFCLVICSNTLHAEFSADDIQDIGFGMPMGAGGESADIDLCPVGAQTVQDFLNAWKHRDYQVMYDLIDDKSKEKYSFDQAKLDFSFMEYKRYYISVIRKTGDNFEFILSYGEWKYGDKEVRKMIISGKSFKIIMPSKHSPFKKSLADYM